MEDTLAVLALRAREKQLGLEFCVFPEVPGALIGDPTRLRQVVVNLVGNAIKFTSRGNVTVSVVKKEQTRNEVVLQFSVKDTGVGIPKDKQAAIFKAFTQADNSTTRKFGGTGLGLAISSRLVEMMGGQIWLESEAGVGSTFYFDARFGLQDALSKEAADELDSLHRTSVLSRGESLRNGAVYPAQDAKGALRILLVEDNPVNQKIALRVLEKRGYVVDLAQTGREALEVLEGNFFDLVLMDIQMPEMDGLEATAAIRRREESTGQHIPIVAMTAHAMAGDRQRCLDAGMDDYISKPIQVKELFRVVENFRGANSIPLVLEPMRDSICQ